MTRRTGRAKPMTAKAGVTKSKKSIDRVSIAYPLFLYIN